MSGERKEKTDVYLSLAPPGLEQEFKTLLTPEAIRFLIDLNLHFENEIDNLYIKRLRTKSIRKKTRKIPKFLKNDYIDDNWKIAPVSKRLQNRHLDLGDVSPSDYMQFITAMKANVQGIQVDFDDGHCPTWKNQIIALHNVYRAVHNEIPNIPVISEAPVLMLRPRAWNMVEHNMSINGKKVPGPIFDFGLLMFHNANILAQSDSGPFFYLSKLEGASEAKLWNEIFTYTQWKLKIPHGTIKACVLIENILSSFEMDQILYELKDHSLGLNCGIWDYAASIISKFGEEKSFLLPDRNKYVNMSKPFLKKYMDLVVRTCHKRNAHATGGMVAKLIPYEKSENFKEVLESVISSKLAEIQAGVDGFMVYDFKLIEHMHNLWNNFGGLNLNQISYLGTTNEITELDLLTLPSGDVTEEGLKHNITVSILFIYNWLCGKGVFAYKGAIEDSATAEISRAQIWQWIRHQAFIENKNEFVTRSLVFKEASNIFQSLSEKQEIDYFAKIKLAIALDVFLEIVNHRDSPEFITTYLNDTYIFKKLQASL